ncbi:response regulator [bacterium]|nr:response regulator [bacterium]
MNYKILIAEDLEDNRFFLQTLLELKGHSVTAAENGKIALGLFHKADFDFVITDIRMPEMDGLSLLCAIKKSSPQTPVIIISAYRELEDVIEALRCGACDYITKPYEEQDVHHSIERAARLRTDETTDKSFMGCQVNASTTYLFDGNPDKINGMARFLCHNLATPNVKAEIQSLQISLIEALSNAVFHGNLEIPSSIKTKDDINSFNTFQALARERNGQAPYNTRKVFIRSMVEPDKISFVIRDEGVGFDYRKLPDPLDPESFLEPSGRGLLMIRSFCDDVTWNETGNEITLVKYRESQT